MTTSAAHIASSDVASFIFAGKAVFTLQSKATGQHYTYRVTASKDGAMFFVAVVHGGAKHYAGIVPADNRIAFRSTRNAKVSRQDPAVRTFEWFLTHLEHEQVEVHHCGTCGRCARKLTDPESIKRGIGPECIKRV
jgi:hypothetical protein